MATKISATLHAWTGHVELRMADESDGQVAPAMHLMFSAYRDPGERVDPFYTFTKDEAQALMDELWRIGLRPNNRSPLCGCP